MADTKPLFVARPSDVAFLKENLDAAVSGKGSAVVLESPLGGGKRALVGELVRSVPDFNGVIWRVPLIEEEEGMRTLLRLYAHLLGAISRDQAMAGRIEASINMELPKHPKRVQQWLQAFIQGIKNRPKVQGDQAQITVPRDNPVLALVHIIRALTNAVPLLMEVQNLHACQSVAISGIIEALLEDISDRKLLMILSIRERSDVNSAWMPLPMLDLLERRKDDLKIHKVAPWGADEVAQYLESRGTEADAAELARIASGRPGFVADLVDMLEEQGKLSDMSGITLANLFPTDVDEDELEEGPAPEPGKRRHAGKDDLHEVAVRAALLGATFPANLLADIGGYDRDSIDDLLDAAGELFEEVEFNKGMNTWLYAFKPSRRRKEQNARAANVVYQEGVLDWAKENHPDFPGLARATGAYMERFLVPRGYDFIVKTARAYAMAGANQQAAVLRSMAVSKDNPQLWPMVHDMMKFHDAVAWPEPMQRTVYMNLMDRMAQGGDVNQAETLFNEILAWADAREDRRLKGWLLFAGSRLDFRRQDFYRGRDRAKDALTLYSALGDKLKVSELHNHLGMIELSDGNPTAALEQVDIALREGTVDTPDGKKAVLPQTAANAEFIRGLVRKRERKFDEAAEHFARANEIAGNTGQAPLALEAGLNYGEVLLVGGKAEKASEILERVVQIAGALQNGIRQRAAMSLLAQAYGAQRKFNDALTWAKRVLQVTEQGRMQAYIAVDTYNVGLFTLMTGNQTEALALFRKAKGLANLKADAGFAKELLFNLGMAADRAGQKAEAKAAFTELLPYANQAKDARKLVAGSIQLARLQKADGENDNARSVLNAALKVAEQTKMAEEKKAIKKALSELG
ncbi:MAG: hypothetical protein VX899_27310 [Myxococcota bacterium]|nr:hypothetical protein [Myxococcota bacterium]